MANVSSFSGAMPMVPGGTTDLAYASVGTITTNVTSTGPPATQTYIGPLSFVADGSPIQFEFFCGEARPPAVASGYLYFSLYVDGLERTRYWGVVQNETSTPGNSPVRLVRRIESISAGSHTAEVRVSCNSTAGTPQLYSAPEATTNATAPAFLRVSKIVNQNDGLKPFWTPPVVTQLPSQATVGDQVIYAADATNGVYWQLQYDGLGTYPWKFIGGGPLSGADSGAVTFSDTTLSGAPNRTPTLTIGLPGDYEVRAWCYGYGGSTTARSINGGPYSSTGVSMTDAEAIVLSGVTSLVGQTGTAAKVLTLAAGTISLRFKQPGGLSSVVEQRGMTVTPIRVKAA